MVNIKDVNESVEKFKGTVAGISETLIKIEEIHNKEIETSNSMKKHLSGLLSESKKVCQFADNIDQNANKLTDLSNKIIASEKNTIKSIEDCKSQNEKNYQELACKIEKISGKIDLKFIDTETSIKELSEALNEATRLISNLKIFAIGCLATSCITVILVIVSLNI